MISAFTIKPPPKTECELLARCYELAGLSFSQLALSLGLQIPANPNYRKGWIGQAIELFLGADAQNKCSPDFQQLGIELKTLPLALSGKPTESTFVTTIPLLTIHEQQWETSQCYAKLKRVLWIPVEGDTEIPYEHRRIGQGLLWSPSAEEYRILASDWNYLTTQIATGQLDTLNATAGDYLQIRPKGADGKSLCDAYNSEGEKVKTLPRGFYLRSLFTATVMTL